MTIPTKPFDAAKHFPTDEARIELIRDAIQSGHVGYIASAIGTVVKARGMTKVAEEAGLNRQTLHKAFSEAGNPTLETLTKVLDTIGLQLDVKPKVLEQA